MGRGGRQAAPGGVNKTIRVGRGAIGNGPAFAQKNLIQRALDPAFSTPAEFAQYLVQSREQVDRIDKKANLQPQ